MMNTLAEARMMIHWATPGRSPLRFSASEGQLVSYVSPLSVLA